jgi:hypothetical protein
MSLQGTRLHDQNLVCYALELEAFDPSRRHLETSPVGAS